MNGTKKGSRKTRWAAIACAAVCVILVAAACLPFAMGRLRIVKCYDDDLTMRALRLAGASYRDQMNQCVAVQQCIEEAKSGHPERLLALDLEDTAEQGERETWMNTAVTLGNALSATGQIFAQTGCTFDEKAFEMFAKRSLVRAQAYRTYCRHLAELIRDETAWAAYGEACMAQLSEVVRTDMLASTGLYQLISRQMVGMRQMQREGYPDASVLEVIPEESLEELLHLSQGDLEARCAERLQAFWEAEGRLGTEWE